MCNFISKQEDVLSGWLEVMVKHRIDKHKLLCNRLIFSPIVDWWNQFLFLIRFLYMRKVHLRNLAGKYAVKGRIITYSASIFYIEITKKHLPICLKMWRFGNRNDGVYDTTTAKKRTDYLIDGFQFNQHFAPGVYLGVALIGKVNNQHIVIKDFTSQIEKIKDLPSRRYAIVMKRLPDEWRLDILLEKALLDTRPMLKFLAQEVACMHKRLEISPMQKMGIFASLEKKLKSNVALLNKMNHRKNKEEDIWFARNVLLEAFKVNEKHFEERKLAGCIKRCHGDLKPSNLWIQPAQRLRPSKLLALDCIDFDRPDFCHIDTLCDVAMLAIALEHSFTLRLGEDQGQEMVEYFLDVYLAYSGEDKDKVSFLLEYYMAEKAIVCTYTSYIYDHLPAWVVDTYFSLISTHVKKLAKLLCDPVDQQVVNIPENRRDCYPPAANNDHLPDVPKEKIDFQTQPCGA